MTNKRARGAFLRFRSAHPTKWDYVSAGLPDPPAARSEPPAAEPSPAPAPAVGLKTLSLAGITPVTSGATAAASKLPANSKLAAAKRISADTQSTVEREKRAAAAERRLKMLAGQQ